MLEREEPQIEAMRFGTEYSFTASIRNFSIQLRPLSMLETIQVAQKVSDVISRIPPTGRVAVAESAILAQETLKIASSSGVGMSDQKITDYLMERMTPEELQALFKEYVAIVDRVNPSLELLPRDSMNSLVETLKKSPTQDLASQLIGLSHSDLVSLAHCLLTSGD